VHFIQNVTWSDTVTTVSAAIKNAGAGGTVVIVSGHGGAVRAISTVESSSGINATTVALTWTPGGFGNGMFWDGDHIGTTPARPGRRKPSTREHCR
jgi:hypothetical protein